MCKKNGIDGYQVTGPNSNSIFIPIAGYKGCSGDEQGLFYWSSTTGAGRNPDSPMSSEGDDAVALRSDCRKPLWGMDRPYSAPIRPVKVREYKD